METNNKLREALAKIRSEAYECDQGGEYLGEGSDPGFDRIVKLCDAALAAPQRNFERFQTKDAAREAFQKLRGHRVWADVSLWDDRDEIEAFLDWLFALGKEGGAK